MIIYLELTSPVKAIPSSLKTFNLSSAKNSQTEITHFAFDPAEIAKLDRQGDQGKQGEQDQAGRPSQDMVGQGLEQERPFIGGIG